MGRISVVLSDQMEDRLRDHAKRKGDISKTIEEALERYFAKKELDR